MDWHFRVEVQLLHRGFPSRVGLHRTLFSSLSTSRGHSNFLTGLFRLHSLCHRLASLNFVIKIVVAHCCRDPRSLIINYLAPPWPNLVTDSNDAKAPRFFFRRSSFLTTLRLYFQDMAALPMSLKSRAKCCPGMPPAGRIIVVFIPGLTKMLLSQSSMFDKMLSAPGPSLVEGLFVLESVGHGFAEGLQPWNV